MASRAEAFSYFLKAMTPTLLALAGVLLLMAPLRLAEGLIPTPILPLLVIFFWSLYAPDYIPTLSVFFVGLAQDLLFAGPLGLWAVLYLGVQFAVTSQRAYFLGREQKVIWIGFAIVVAASGLFYWLMMSLVTGGLLPLGALGAQILATILTYPLFGALFRRFHRRILVES